MAGAVEAFDRATEADPASAQAQLHAGVARLQLGHWARGVAHLRVSVAADPSNAEAWSNLAMGERELGRLEEARQAVGRALAIDPALAPAWNLQGLLLQAMGRHEESAACFERALGLDPAFAIAAMNLGNGHQMRGELPRAEAAYRRALAIDPREAEIHYNLGHLFHKCGRVRESLAPYREATRLRPSYAMAHNNLAHALFLLGEFAEAWREHAGRAPRVQFEAALAAQGRRYALPAPGSLRGRTLSIRAEQGLGDILFFLRFAPGLSAAGARLAFSGEARLAPLLARTGHFMPAGPAPGDAAKSGDEVLAGDLALLLDPSAVPPPLALVPDPAALARVEARLAAYGPKPWIGVAWRSGIPKLEMLETLHKEVPVEALGAALAASRGTLVSVQREPRGGEREALAGAAGREVHDASALNADLEEALAAMALLDDYVGVSSTNVHLRAGCGRSARILVPFPPEWRWLAEGPSPWFPAFTLYRQDAVRGWAPALERLGHDLAAP